MRSREVVDMAAAQGREGEVAEDDGGEGGGGGLWVCG
jgi:hypothetical protein